MVAPFLPQQEHEAMIMIATLAGSAVYAIMRIGDQPLYFCAGMAACAMLTVPVLSF